jgi:DNA-directed RNA polymerase subunit RPC12/RpoP
MEVIDKERPPKFSNLSKRLFFHVTCQKTRKNYMMRYRYWPDEKSYIAQDAVPLPTDFFSDGAMKSPPIDTDLLQGGVDCPYCGSIAWAKCGFCSHLFCLDPNTVGKSLKCPVCETSLSISNESSPFSIDGSQG